MFLKPVCQSHKDQRKPSDLYNCQKEARLRKKERKKRFSINPRTVSRSAPLLRETTCPWDHAQAHPRDLPTNARLHRALQTEALKTGTAPLQKRASKICSTVWSTSSCSKCEQERSRLVHKSSSKSPPERQFSTTRAPKPGPSIAAHFSRNPVQFKATSQVRFTICCRFGFKVTLGIPKNHSANLSRIRIQRDI